MDVLFNIKQAASKLKVSPLTLRAWIYEGKLAPVKLGRRVLLTERELERFIDTQDLEDFIQRNKMTIK